MVSKTLQYPCFPPTALAPHSQSLVLFPSVKMFNSCVLQDISLHYLHSLSSSTFLMISSNCMSSSNYLFTDSFQMYISPQDLSLIFKIYILNILIQDIYRIFDLCLFVEIFSLSVVSFFILLTVSFEEQTLSILMNSQFICVFLWTVFLRLYL